ncbi:MAG TPA: hypothetical protein VHQ01_04720, partial [Pyrinomonadaceae bacterium]|nr:hypothetical protein [Pyrinomonadaceae bacterium]
MPKYRRNPFVSGTVTHENTGSLTGYGYIGKDIYGRFHNSPVLYKTEREAKEALMKRKFKRNPAYRTQKNQGWFFVRFRFQGKVNYLAKRSAGGGFTTKLSEAQPFPEVQAIKEAEAIRGSQILRLEAADIKKYIG